MSVTFSAGLTGEPVNMNNANAAHVLSALGYYETYGAEDAGLFLGRVLLALALAPQDAGRPAAGDGRYIDCGRPQGYTQERLMQLHGLAATAQASGRRVTWG
ncbi:hypothetical protein STHAL_33090 [Streptomyces halstedii]|uniref:Uncharacterized protein n=1 Tax=Streptomyces halstedii TaxID=1944 RepID=A0ABS6U162_STRHA|nr:hypothetical protein [Streptomyces halstedii]MBV7674284.1 hypothetical protein [Streptomyces halstedii]